jgi:signal peptidase I
VAAAFVVVLACGWLRVTPVLSGSMRPGISPGDAVLTQRVESGSLRTGDIIVVRTPPEYGGGQIMHRVASVAHSGGATIVTTQGDANNVADPWHAVLPPTVYRERVVLPYLGWVVNVRTHGGAFVLLAIGAALAVLLGARRVARVRQLRRDRPVVGANTITDTMRQERSHMRKVNKVLIGVLVGASAVVAVIGSGAGASFTQSIFATQAINAGTLNVTLTGPGTTSVDGKTITLSPLGPVGSTFTSGVQSITISNQGNIAATQTSLSAAETHSGGTSGAALAGELGVTVRDGGTVVYDGLLSGLIASPATLTGTIAPNSTRQLRVTFYAGSGTIPSLDNAAQGGSVTPTLTLDYSG